MEEARDQGETRFYSVLPWPDQLTLDWAEGALIASLRPQTAGF